MRMKTKWRPTRPRIFVIAILYSKSVVRFLDFDTKIILTNFVIYHILEQDGAKKQNVGKHDQMICFNFVFVSVLF